MSFVDSMARTVTPRLIFWGAVLCVIALLIVVFINREPPQPTPATDTVASASPAAKPSAPAGVTVRPGPQWTELSAAHKKALQPLASTWNSLGPTHKAKWLALADNYSVRSPEDQAKLQSRMAEWAALTPRERELARLNFAESKKLRSGELAAEWAAYQELSADERKRLAAQAAEKPAGAAVAVTPVSSDKITAVPITRRTGQQPESAVTVKPLIDPNTLLPKIAAPTGVEAPPNPAPAVTTPGISSDALSPN